jgi:hypothetical protein
MMPSVQVCDGFAGGHAERREQRRRALIMSARCCFAGGIWRRRSPFCSSLRSSSLIVSPLTGGAIAASSKVRVAIASVGHHLLYEAALGHASRSA